MPSIVDELQRRLQNLDERAKAAGSNMTQVCKSTGTARITYERWRSRAPQVFHKIDEMEAEVERLESEHAKAEKAAKRAAK